jgi:hypothetical protein
MVMVEFAVELSWLSPYREFNPSMMHAILIKK